MASDAEKVADQAGTQYSFSGAINTFTTRAPTAAHEPLPACRPDGQPRHLARTVRRGEPGDCPSGWPAGRWRWTMRSSL